MNNFLLNIITLIHVLFILFVLLVPFIGNRKILGLYIIIIPFLIAHWILNSNICVLSILESNIRTKINNGNPVSPDDCFTCSLFNPIYDFKSNNKNYSHIIYMITIILWIIAIYKFNKLKK